jgi:glycosyltransferase involved in cell wall biosynthesis
MFRPVDRDAARSRIGLGLMAGDLIVVYVGRILPRKDVRNVVRALATLARTDGHLPVKLLLVGGESADPDPVAAPEIGELRRLAGELGIADRVLFAGRRQPEELRHYYGAGDVVVTTPWYEPFGLTPLEGMACARPVIGSAVGGIAFTVRHGETGYLVPARAPEALADRLRELLTQPDLRARMGRTARARVEREFTWPTVARRTAALYESLWVQRAAGARPSAIDSCPSAAAAGSIAGGTGRQGMVGTADV